MPQSAAIDHVQRSNDARILTKAVNRIADLWNLSNAKLGEILGLSPATVSRLRNGLKELEPGSKEFELAQYLARLFRGLDAIVGSDDRAARSWLMTENLDLKARPIDLIVKIKGLMTACDYVDAYRARV
ncbi:MbcA/ParS/Xre antitoxin family protein [Pseudokordiimonas caeni]|uniref:MbcA/ParS/Xre antitoxin family protein n=1 Tax=Pseudokordiimonas caeni TaxID=2997908 RepID=UPI0028125108|nr:antitoxin Xre-like helix-turn-helix domain-containing protein [Pseudokordiimonas caeni]